MTETRIISFVEKQKKNLVELEDKVSISSKVNSLQYVYHTKMTLPNVIVAFS